MVMDLICKLFTLKKIYLFFNKSRVRNNKPKPSPSPKDGLSLDLSKFRVDSDPINTVGALSLFSQKTKKQNKKHELSAKQEFLEFSNLTDYSITIYKLSPFL